MQYVTYPYYCGSNLDPGEKCTCGGKEKGAALHHQELPQNKTSTVSIAALAPAVKDFDLKRLRKESGASGKDLVSVVRELYPKYDKALQSKCEHGDEYGIELRKDAKEALVARFLPGQVDNQLQAETAAAASPKRDRHRLKNSIRCRLPAALYGPFVLGLKEDGITIQEWMTAHVLHYLKQRQNQERSSTT